MAIEESINRKNALDTEYDQIMRENRRGREMWDALREYPDVHFNYFSGDPWTEVVSVFKDDPYFEVWQEGIQAYREKCDRETYGAVSADATP